MDKERLSQMVKDSHRPDLQDAPESWAGRHVLAKGRAAGLDEAWRFESATASASELASLALETRPIELRSWAESLLSSLGGPVAVLRLTVPEVAEAVATYPQLRTPVESLLLLTLLEVGQQVNGYDEITPERVAYSLHAGDVLDEVVQDFMLGRQQLASIVPSMLRLTLLALPRKHRLEYRRIFLSELFELAPSSRSQRSYSFRTLCSAWSLRQELR